MSERLRLRLITAALLIIASLIVLLATLPVYGPVRLNAPERDPAVDAAIPAELYGIIIGISGLSLAIMILNGAIRPNGTCGVTDRFQGDLRVCTLNVNHEGAHKWESGE